MVCDSLSEAKPEKYIMGIKLKANSSENIFKFINYIIARLVMLSQLEGSPHF
jgi:hypothetical protein